MMGSRTTTSMSLAVLELLLDEHAVKEPDGRRHGPVLAVSPSARATRAPTRSPMQDRKKRENKDSRADTGESSS